MATLSGAQSSVIAGGTSSFGQFRLTTFVDSTPKSSRTAITSPGLTISSADEIAQPASLRDSSSSTLSSSNTLNAFSSTLQSTSQPFAPTPPTSTAVPALSMEAMSRSHNGFGVLDMTPVPVREGKLGPHRDGRVRNPVPLKLKGMTDDKNGNFAVMHMDMSRSTGVIDMPRGEAAQRTSEKIAHAAKTANKEAYLPMKRRRVEAPRSVQPIPVENLSQPSTFLSGPSRYETAHRTRILTSEEIKYEQARLLTLLRSINPLTVVDQICKALAFFGGIPGAPPPEDGTFPESADANGNGGLFVGWLSEIFPELERQGWGLEATKQQRDAPQATRPRGRPKGSKASKVRKDKGIKKGPKISGKAESKRLLPPTLANLRPAIGGSTEVVNLEEEWIDVVEPDVQVERNDGTRKGQPSAEKSRNRPPGQHSDRNPGANIEIVDLVADHETGHQSFGTSSQEQSLRSLTPGKRRPGRPKGSRNRPKNHDLERNFGVAFKSSGIQQLGQSHGSSGTPEFHHTPGPLVSSGADKKQNEATNVDHLSTPIPGRVTTIMSAQQSSPSAVKRRQGQISKDNVTPTAPTPVLSAEERALLDAFRSERALQSVAKSGPSTEKGKKSRPRSAISPTTEISTAAPSALTNSNTEIIPVKTANTTIHATPTSQPKDSGPILPPPKRQRKPKDANATPAKKVSQPADRSSPATGPVVALKSTTVSAEPVVQSVVSSTRPPAQGLEAHYERFASLSHQGDQQQQQQQNQHKKQQQQQGRHDINVVTRSSPMQSASAYYQQSRHVSTPYDQYSSHQVSNPYQPALLAQSDTFRNTNPQHNTFSPRQQQTSHHFSPFPDSSSFIEVPTLEPMSNGTSNVNTFGQGLSRTASNTSFGSGAQMGNGYENLSDNELRERLMRGIGRR